MIPDNLRYSEEHEWVRDDGEGEVTVGITLFAADSLGDVVYVELPDVDAKLAQFGKMGEVESVKAVSDLYSPVSGAVVSVNETLLEHPELVNNDPFSEGWMIKVVLDTSEQLNSLMTADQYKSFTNGQD